MVWFLSHFRIKIAMKIDGNHDIKNEPICDINPGTIRSIVSQNLFSSKCIIVSIMDRLNSRFIHFTFAIGMAV